MTGLRITAATALLAIGTTAALAEDPHTHGHATMTIAVEGNSVAIEIEAPGASVVGFERAASTDEEKAAVEAAEAQFADPMGLLTLPEAAGCTVESAESELHQDGDHNEFEAEYALACEDTAAIDAIETRMFEVFAPLEELTIEYATPAGQGALELERGDEPRIALATG